MDTTRAEAEVHDALDDAGLRGELRDRIDNALAQWIRAERADVLDHLVIGIENDAAGGIETWLRRPLD